MYKRIAAVLAISMCLVFYTGCQKNQPDNNKSETVSYEIIDPTALKGEAIVSWYEESYWRGAVHSVNHTDGFEYVIISAGERPTGGYTVSIDKAQMEENTLVFYAALLPPPQGTAVTQAITYPHILLRFAAKEAVAVRAELDISKAPPVVPEGNAPETEKEGGAEEEKSYEVSGQYVGQIDGNSVEVVVDGNPQAFRVTSEVKEYIEKENIDTGRKVTIMYRQSPSGPEITKIKLAGKE